MQPDWKDYLVPGPAKPLLSRADVCALLGEISGDTLDRQIAAGRFPRGMKASPQSPMLWSAAVVACWLQIAPMLTEEKEKDPRPAKDI